jgi:multidrug resistance efflux pump
MEILLLGIYSFFAWLVFFKFKWLPWNITSQVITITIPVIALTILILTLNIVAPSSHDVRVMNYVVQVVPSVTGQVIDVPVEPNRPVKKGDVLFKIDPVPFQLDMNAQQAKIQSLQAQLVTAESNTKALQDQLKNAVGKKDALNSKLDLAKMRVKQYRELAETGAGNKFDLEQAEADVKNMENDLSALAANEDQVKKKLASKTKEGEPDEIALVKGQIAEATARFEDAKWNLTQTVFYAPADGTIVNLQLRKGSRASQLPMAPVMSFVENEQWIIAMYDQNELRDVEPGNEAEISLETYPGQIIRCKVDSIVWATGQGQLPIGGMLPQTGSEPLPVGRFAVKMLTEGEDKHLFLAPGARGAAAIYTEHAKVIHLVRKVIMRINTKLNWFIFKLH